MEAARNKRRKKFIVIAEAISRKIHVSRIESFHRKKRVFPGENYSLRKVKMKFPTAPVFLRSSSINGVRFAFITTWNTARTKFLIIF